MHVSDDEKTGSSSDAQRQSMALQSDQKLNSEKSAVSTVEFEALAGLKSRTDLCSITTRTKTL